MDKAVSSRRPTVLKPAAIDSARVVERTMGSWPDFIGLMSGWRGFGN